MISRVIIKLISVVFTFSTITILFL